MANCPAKNGVMKSMVKPIPHKMNRKGGGTNDDTTQIAADIAKPIEYFSVRGQARGIRRPIRKRFQYNDL